MHLRLKPGVIVVDKREERSGIPSLLRELGISVRYEMLEVGDYLLPGDILVERKSARDFISSLLDGRLFDQSSNLGYDFKITLFYTPDVEETAALLAAISKRKTGGKEEVYLKPKKKSGGLEDLQLSIVASLPGVGTARARKLLEGFRTIKAIFNADPAQLSRIGNLPYETSVKICDLINSEYRGGKPESQSKIDYFDDGRA